MSKLNKRFLKRFDEFLVENDVQFDQFLERLADAQEASITPDCHPGVKGCLETCATYLREAAMAWYVSTK